MKQTIAHNYNPNHKLKMRTLLITVLLAIVSQVGFTQTIEFDLISYNGLQFYSTKTEIIKKLGKPKSTYEPNYECGFLSSDWQETKYFTLDFEEVKFTGNEKELYLFDQVNFENDNSIIIKYGNHNLTCETKLSDLIKIFGKELEKFFDKNSNGSAILFHKKTDDGIRIEIKNGKLTRFEYWSPC